MIPLDPRALLRDSVLEVRGDGKAGGGLVLAFQSLAGLLAGQGLHVQEWPFFSSARRGANIRSFLRAGERPVAIACEISRPAIAVLMDEAAARSVDFAQGVREGGTFVINTRHSPGECARHFGLSGRVFTIPGDEIGARHLHAPIGNVSAYAALARAIGGFTDEAIVEGFLATLQKRRVPASLLERNRAALGASLEAIRSDSFDVLDLARPAPPAFASYGDLPVGAQSALRLSQGNRTSDYARSGFRLRFEDPDTRCTGCAHCITNCPEGIILWKPDPERGLLVTGAEVSSFCKLCGECIAVCPERLFSEAPFEEHWPESTERTS